jgi:[NiFe] hydrogenase assembly HybE family chaperone
MAARRFEGSYLGDAARLPPAARMECKICWHVYDPAEGCDVWQVPAGTPFAALPEEWRCPRCDGDREQFMVLDAGEPAAAPPAAAPTRSADPRADLAAEAARRFEAGFREIHAGQMRGVPLVNEALAVKAVGFRPHGESLLGVVVTPWFMNLVLAPGPDENWSALPVGGKELVEFPSGRYEFVTARRDGLGTYKACSLFSPMFDFTSLLQATDTAAAVMVALFDPAIREDGDRAGEIRRRREEELAATDAGEADKAVAAFDVGQAPDARAEASAADPAAAAAPSRRTLILGGAGGARRTDASS